MTIHYLTDQFEAFVDAKDPSIKYDYDDFSNCALAQFYQSKGYRYDVLDDDLEVLAQGTNRPSTSHAFRLPENDSRFPTGWTFGELSQRIHAYRELVN